MQKKKLVKLILISIFIALQTFLTIRLLGGFSRNTNHLSYLIIILCVSFSFVLINKRNYLINIGMVFTVCADFFLVPKFNGFYNQVWGVIFFIGAQIAYAMYLYFMSDTKLKLPSLIIRATMSLIGIAAPLIILPLINNGTPADFLSVITIFYLANLLCNVVFGFINFKKNPLLTIGLFLFLGCDICTGVQAAHYGGYLVIPSSSFLYNVFVNPPFDLTWMFYAPSQILISLSAETDYRQYLHLK